MIYIAGPISGLPNDNREEFRRATIALVESGHQCVNPLDLTHHDMPWTQCMRITLKAMLDCDGVVLLKGWQNSRGAAIEYELAERLDIPVKPLEEWIESIS